MALYADQAGLAIDATWKSRLQAAAAETATQIGLAVLAQRERNEVDKARYRLANMVLADLETWAEIFAWAVAVQGSITLGSTDLEIKDQINVLWNLLANVPI